jgi:hypothetical protein
MEELLGEVFSIRFVPRLYIEEQLQLQGNLETAMRRVGGWCEMAVVLEVSQLEQLVNCRTVASR